MSSATIRRGAGRGGRSSAPKPRGRAAPRRQTRLDRLIALLPMSRRTLNRLAAWLAGLTGIAAFWFLASFLGLPAMARQEAADLAARAGFSVAKVEVHGTRHMDEMPVYALALDEIDRSMLSVDLEALRGRIMTLGWVADARITRRLPGTLVVDIVERQPAAIWQRDNKLSLIDANGVVLENLDAAALPDLPLVIGPHANRETKALHALMAAAPALKPLVAGATWVGNRRWDIRFQSGETLALPEGDAAAAAALMKFAQLDGINRLLGRGIVRFDMRDPSRFVLRMPPDRAKDAGDTAKSATPAKADADSAGPDAANAGGGSSPSARSGEA